MIKSNNPHLAGGEQNTCQKGSLLSNTDDRSIIQSNYSCLFTTQFAWAIPIRHHLIRFANQGANTDADQSNLPWGSWRGVFAQVALKTPGAFI